MTVVRRTQADGGVYQFAWMPAPNSAQVYSIGGGGGSAPSQSSVVAFRGCTGCSEGFLPLVAQVDVTNPLGYVRRVVFGTTGYTTSDTHALNQLEQQVTTYQYYADNLLQSAADALATRRESLARPKTESEQKV